MRNLELKEFFAERMKEIFNNEEDFQKYLDILKIGPVNSIRCNTLKISIEELKEKLESKSWKITQPFNDYPEVMIIESNLLPGELGRSMEHLLGYYYIQEISSMLPVMALQPKENEIVLDLCSAPGSKTTQMAAKMNNTGTIIANEVSLGRIKILANNTERCGVTNVIITKKEGVALCNKFKKDGIKFDKILLDAPCSGEGTLRSTPKTYSMWNINTIKKLSSIQKNLFEASFEILKENGEMIYSTCTHAPEENEAIVNFALEKFKDQIEIEVIKLPIKTRPGIQQWQDEKYAEEVKFSCRVYPHDNNTEGFFLAKFRRIK
jgi:NOL1/NOP2/sun family putative RNA methylase